MAWVLTDTTTGVNLTAETDAQSVLLAQRAYAETSRLSAKITDESGTITIATEHEISLMDGAVLAFAGYVRTRTRTDQGSSAQRVYEIECQDYTTALGDDVCDTSTAIRPAGESDKARIAALGAAFGTRGIVYTGTAIVQLRASMPDQDFQTLNLHQCMTAICQITGGSFYVGYDKQLHYFASEALSAPFGLSDAPNGSTTFGYENFRLADDSAQFVNAVFVVGEGISGWRTAGGVAIATIRAAGTLRAMVINNPEVTDATTLNAVGDSALATYGSVLLPAELTTYQPGLKAGMNVQITHAGWGVSAVSYRIASIEARPVDANRIAYQVFFGSNPLDFNDLMRESGLSVAEAYLAATSAEASVSAVLDTSVGGGNLVPNSSFEDGTIWTVGSNWTIGFAAADAFRGAKEARYVPTASQASLSTPFITVDRTDVYWASAWIFCRAFTSGRLRMVVEEYNAANTLLATTVVGEVAALDTKYNRVSRKFAATAGLGYTTWQATTAKVKIVFRPDGVNATGTWSVDGVQLERGGLLTAYAPAPYEIVDGSIVTTDIADDAITSPKIIAGAVVAGKIAALSIGTGELAAGSVTTAKLAAGAITLFDEYGSTSLTPSGFSGAWQDFISDGLYNSTFRYGIAGAIPSGRTSALPFWTVDRIPHAPSPGPTIAVVADTAWPGGLYFQTTPQFLNDYGILTSDMVPFAPTEPVAISAIAAAVCAGGSIPTLFGTIDFYAADQTTLISSVGVNLVTFNVSNVIPLRYSSGPIPPPSDARYIRVTLSFTEGTAHSSSTKMRVGGAALVRSLTAGMQSQAWPSGSGPMISGFTIAQSIPADRTFLMPIDIVAPLDVTQVSFLSAATSGGQFIEFKLYVDADRSGILQYVPGFQGSTTFTPTVKSIRSMPVLSAGRLRPGSYWLAFRNYHASNTLTVGRMDSLITLYNGQPQVSAILDGLGSLPPTTIDMTTFGQLPYVFGIWLGGWSGLQPWG